MVFHRAALGETRRKDDFVTTWEALGAFFPEDTKLSLEAHNAGADVTKTIRLMKAYLLRASSMPPTRKSTPMGERYRKRKNRKCLEFGQHCCRWRDSLDKWPPSSTVSTICNHHVIRIEILRLRNFLTIDKCARAQGCIEVAGEGKAKRRANWALPSHILLRCLVPAWPVTGMPVAMFVAMPLATFIFIGSMSTS